MPKFLRRRAVAARYAVPSTFDDWLAKGLFAKPVRLGARTVGWSIDEFGAWEQLRQHGRAGFGDGR